MSNESRVPETDMATAFRKQVYLLLIVVSAGLMLGRIIAVDNQFDSAVARVKWSQIPDKLEKRKEALLKEGKTDAQIQRLLASAKVREQHAALQGQRPFLSANDRSRWCTIRALVEPKMRVKDKQGKIVWFAIDKVQDIDGWDTIDMVKHPLPPFDTNPDAVGYLYSSKPPLLPILMSVPYYLMYHGTGGRLSFENDPYCVVRLMLVLINLIPTVFCWVLMSRLVERWAATDWCRIFMMAAICFGTFVSTFVVTLNNHIPGACCVMVSMYAASRILFDGKREIQYFLIAGLFATLGISCELPMLSYAVLLLAALFFVAPLRTMSGYVPMMLLVFVAFFVTNFAAHQTWVPAYANKTWYDYKYFRDGKLRESHWNHRIGFDKGEKSVLTYAYQTTIGHHGIFSLTPIWCLSAAGLFFWLFKRKEKVDDDLRYRFVAIFIVALSIICFAFYMSRPQVDRNYGGMTCCFRWMFWFIPLWAIAMTPAVDRLSRSKWGRALCLVLLLASIMSVAFPVWNPWDNPWYYYLMKHLKFTVIS